MTDLLLNMRKINKLLLHNDGEIIVWNNLKIVLSEILKARIFIWGLNGELLSEFKTASESCAYEEKDCENTNSDLNKALLDISEPAYADCKVKQSLAQNDIFIEEVNGIFYIIPIISDEKRLATLLVCKEEAYLSNDFVIMEYAAALIAMTLLRIQNEQSAAQKRNKQKVSIAYAALSYSEVEAVACILKDVIAGDGFVVASKIADSAGITRSVIVNALSKLESAGLMEIHSLGMKGTYVKILNDFFFSEFQRLYAAK